MENTFNGYPLILESENNENNTDFFTMVKDPFSNCLIIGGRTSSQALIANGLVSDSALLISLDFESGSLNWFMTYSIPK